MSKNKKRTNHTHQEKQKDEVEFENVEVVDVSNSIIFVQVPYGEGLLKITCHPSGKLRQNSIHILQGDIVNVTCSAYDLTKGRVTKRHAR